MDDETLGLLMGLLLENDMDMIPELGGLSRGLVWRRHGETLELRQEKNKYREYAVRSCQRHHPVEVSLLSRRRPNTETSSTWSTCVLMLMWEPVSRTIRIHMTLDCVCLLLKG